MKPLILDPRCVIPWQHTLTYDYFLKKAREERRYPESRPECLARIRWYLAGEPLDLHGKGWRSVPPVPVVRAPRDLRDLGDFVVYNGHHRLASASKAGIHLPSYLLEHDEDLDRGVLSPEYLKWVDQRNLSSPRHCLDAHRDFVWEKARILFQRWESFDSVDRCTLKLYALCNDRSPPKRVLYRR